MAPVFTKVIEKAYWKGKEFVFHTGLHRLRYRLMHGRKDLFVCPLCHYAGPFIAQLTPDTIREHSLCWKCRSPERHRLQYLVMKTLGAQMDFSRMSLLHYAPERVFQALFRTWFRHYTTADMVRADVHYQIDLRALPFADKSFDCVYASHALEHIKEDDRALSEIHRVLTPSGIAVLPVPIVAGTTIEYPHADECGHVRAPGADYFEKYAKYFAQVKTFSSNDFPRKYQVFIYEDRTVWPTPERPLAPPMAGDKHLDIVPVGYVRS